jgi:hypothetical protein
MRFNINLEPMEVGVVVSSPVGKLVICRKIAMGCPIHIEGRTLTTNLIVFDIEGFDIILGMDWLSNNHVIIDCYNKEIIFGLLANSKFKFVGTKVDATPSINLSNAGQAITSRRMSSLSGMLKGVVSGREEDGGNTCSARISRRFSKRFSRTSPQQGNRILY